MIANTDISSSHVDAQAGGPESAVIGALFRFWESKVLISAVALHVFDALEVEPLDLDVLTRRVGIHRRGARDLFDALVALGWLNHIDGRYVNGPAASRYLCRSKPHYLGDLADLADTRLYPVWNKLTEALRSGEPQNEARETPDYYSNLMQHGDRLRVFTRAMTSLSAEAGARIAGLLPWQQYARVADLGGAEGAVVIELLREHPHLSGICLELPEVEPCFRERVRGSGVEARASFHAADFFVDPLPSVDVLVLGHVLHNWDLSQKKRLIARCYEALAPGGVLLVYDAMIDDDRRANGFGLLMSLNMLLVTAGGAGYTVADCRQWLQEAGFHGVRAESLTAADAAVIGYK